MSVEYGQYVPPDPNITHFSTGHYVQRVTVNERFIMVEDPWQHDFIVGGGDKGLFYDFYTTPNMYRSMAVSQLCKSRSSGTIPNLYTFTRASGLFAQHQAIEHFSRDLDLTDDERIAYHLRAEGDDQAHTAWSHALEQAVQKWGGPENYHEEIWPLIATLGGTASVLDKHGVKYDEKLQVPGIAIPPWVAGERPGIDVDNLQYIISEGLSWFDHDGADPQVRERVKAAVKIENFEVTPEGQLAWKDVVTALILAKMLLLEASEHWNEPINRTQLYNQIQAAQRCIVKRRLSWMDKVDKGQTRKPEQYLHAIDQVFIDAMESGPGRSDDFIYVLNNSLNGIAMEDRKRFIDYRLSQYQAFLMDDLTTDFPSEHLKPKRVEFGPNFSNVSTEVVEQADMVNSGIGKLPALDKEAPHIQFSAGPLKNRWIDPLVRYKDGYAPLSEIHPPYNRLLKEQQHLQSLGIIVTLMFTDEHNQAFRDGIEQNEHEFEQVRDRPDLTMDQRRRIIEKGAERGKELSQAAGTLVLKNVA